MPSLSRIDLNLLVVFEAIFTEGGITRTARRLNLTQPAISHALARLRELFDDPLFDRQGHKMVPTPLARSVIDPVRRALATIDGVLDAGGRFDPSTAERRFTIGLRDTMEAAVLPKLMGLFARVAPHLELASVRVDRTQFEQDLAVGRYDATVDILIPASSKVRHTQVVAEGLVVVARRGHPRFDAPLTLATYLDLDHIHVTSSELALGFADQEVARAGAHRRIKLRCQQSFAACRVVSETDLVLTMPARYAHIANLLFENIVVPVPFARPEQDLHLYWHVNSDRDPANVWLRERLMEAFDVPSPGA